MWNEISLDLLHYVEFFHFPQIAIAYTQGYRCAEEGEEHPCLRGRTVFGRTPTQIWMFYDTINYSLQLRNITHFYTWIINIYFNRAEETIGILKSNIPNLYKMTSLKHQQTWPIFPFFFIHIRSQAGLFGLEISIFSLLRPCELLDSSCPLDNSMKTEQKAATKSVSRFGAPGWSMHYTDKSFISVTTV